MSYSVIDGLVVIALYYRCIVRLWAITTGLENVLLHSCIVSRCILYFWFVCLPRLSEMTLQSINQSINH